MPRLFTYVGDSWAAERVTDEAPARPLRTVAELAEVLEGFESDGHQQADDFCTYVVDQDGYLRVAPRRSEHVVCAGGGPVLAAGEVRFGDDFGVEEVTNQSTAKLRCGWGPTNLSI